MNTKHSARATQQTILARGAAIDVNTIFGEAEINSD